jgi:nucleoside-diphosphate-sugar epimerase
MRVLVIGGAGYIGARVVSALLERDQEVVASDLRPRAADVRRHDLSDPEATEDLLTSVRPDVVVQLAYTLARDCVHDAHAALRVNVMGVDRVFEACVRHAVPRVVYASSNAVYGDQGDFGAAEVDEGVHGRPRSLYGCMKQMNEAMAAHYDSAGGTRFVGVRVGSAFGRGRWGGTFNPIADVARQLAQDGGAIVIPYAAEHAACFVHVDDVATVFAELALAPMVAERMYNTGGEHVTMGRLAELAAELTEREVRCAEPGLPMSHVSRVSWARLRAEFGGAASRAPVPQAMRDAVGELLAGTPTRV